MNSKRRQLTKRERQEVHQKTGGKCAYCGCELPYDKMQVDHVVPLHIGGTDAIENMLPACRSCNHYKSTLTLGKFRNCVEKFHEVLMRDSVTYKNAVRFGIVIPRPHKVEFYFEKLQREENAK